MRGDLDETLARMARREEALRRRAGTPDDEADGIAPARPAGGAGTYRSRDGREPVTREPDGRQPVARETDGRQPVAREPEAGRPLAGQPVARDPVEEVAEAVRRVVAAHPGLAVTLRVEHDGRAYPLRVSWAGPDVTVGAEAVAKPPPAWPMSVKTVSAPGQDGPGADPAARLAELIRRDPSLLADPGPLP
ncbi:hypothetical protein MRQ36_10675 [Micromonospora sp. R77]|uniref:hypothetical protein n=1 Tax=Micromonospora sp. R77 TaxID=2925836 RepID=UPI001F60DCC7|nr:hypothetical protein [Micromonospora sp. R77]MCI4063014.1 hypothetical protein [Micromonospora sp. R77]